jgi:hypothetical protein
MCVYRFVFKDSGNKWIWRIVFCWINSFISGYCIKDDVCTDIEFFKDKINAATNYFDGGCVDLVCFCWTRGEEKDAVLKGAIKVLRKLEKMCPKTV